MADEYGWLDFSKNILSKIIKIRIFPKINRREIEDDVSCATFAVYCAKSLIISP